MDEKILTEKVLNIINKNYSDIRAISIPEDKVFYFDLNDGNISISKIGTYTEFVNEIAKYVLKEDLNTYLQALSLNKLENDFKKGNTEFKIKYRKRLVTGEYRWNLNIINYLPVETTKLIFIMSEDIQDRLIEEEVNNDKLRSQVVNYKERLESESESMANALYQVNNMLDRGSQSDSFQISNTRNYINTVFNNASLSNPELNQALASKLTESSNYTKPSILIVDDSSIIRNSLKRIFQVDYNIITATNGNEAIELLKNNVLNSSITNKSENIVGILLDLVMPQSDGFEVLNFMKNFNLLHKIPVAIISGDETKETRKKVYQYEIVDMLEKPFNTDTIRRRIGKIINLYMSSNNLQNIVAIQDHAVGVTSSDDDYKMIINQIVSNIINTPEATKLKEVVRHLAVSLSNNYPNYNIDGKMVTAITNTAPLYNIGSIALKDKQTITIASIKQEIDYGLIILKAVASEEDMEIGKNIIKYSCEMYNGTGFPNKIKGSDIPIEAQITNLAARIVKNPKEISSTIKTIIDSESNKYNPELIDSLEKIKKDLKNI